MSDKQKQLLFSVTKKDFDVQTFRSGGPGGQNQNKVESGVRIVHRPSGAAGESREHRDRPHNKKAAFRRLIATDTFKAWQRIQIAARVKGTAYIDRKVALAMRPENIKVETYDSADGKWK